MGESLGTVDSCGPWHEDQVPGPATRTPGARRNWSRWWALWLVLGYLAQVAFRLWLSHGQLMPLANPDESAYLIEARVLAHAGPPSDFSYGTLYQGGYSLLLVPIYWFTSNSVTVYHAALVVNAVGNALLMPLAYLALRRLALRRGVAYLGAVVAALVPEGVFYTQYAMSDAIFPVVVLAWLLTVHTWLTAKGWRASLGWGALAAVLAAYSYAVHPRGLVVIVAYALVALYAVIRRMVPVWALAPPAVAGAAVLGATRTLQHRIIALLYPEGPRSLRSETLSRLGKPRDQIRVIEMAGGQLWRVFTDTWGIAALGILAALILVFRRRAREDMRVMAALLIIVLVATVFVAPAALPDGQQTNWASGRYPDAMEVTFFIIGLAVLVRARSRWLVGYGVASAVISAGLAAVVAHYAGMYQHVAGFGAFNWAEPAVLAQEWNYLSVRKATAVAIGLLALWVGLAVILRWLSGRFPGGWKSGRWRVALLVPLLAMNVFALVQMTTRISHAGTADQRPNSLALVTATGLRPGEKVVLDYDMWTDWYSWIPQSFEVWWTPLTMTNGAQGYLPAGTTVFEVAWPSGRTAEQTWPQHLPGWHVVASNREYQWVAWRGPAATGHR